MYLSIYQKKKIIIIQKYVFDDGFLLFVKNLNFYIIYDVILYSKNINGYTQAKPYEFFC